MSTILFARISSGAFVSWPVLLTFALLMVFSTFLWPSVSLGLWSLGLVFLLAGLCSLSAFWLRSSYFLHLQRLDFSLNELRWEDFICAYSIAFDLFRTSLAGLWISSCSPVGSLPRKTSGHLIASRFRDYIGWFPVPLRLYRFNDPLRLYRSNEFLWGPLS